MADVVNFFAYGKLINEDYFKEKGLEYISKSSVTLSAWRRVFNKIPIDNGGLEKLGLVNIEPTPDNSGMMHGELYVMDEKFLPKLDELFGHPDEYQRKVMRFNRHDFILVNGLTYIARPDKIATGLKPSKATMKIFRKAKKLFPMLYFSRLMNTPTCD
jgi:gamma-glutamylcyclotransferase (GGCT)/AIG2-like uncharacterized protein YtfP